MHSAFKIKLYSKYWTCILLNERSSFINQASAVRTRKCAKLQVPFRFHQRFAPKRNRCLKPMIHWGKFPELPAVLTGCSRHRSTPVGWLRQSTNRRWSVAWLTNGPAGNHGEFSSMFNSSQSDHILKKLASSRSRKILKFAKRGARGPRITH